MGAGLSTACMVVSFIESEVYEFYWAEQFDRNFRALQLEAISRILMKQVEGPRVFRVTQEALLLTAACVWLVNCLHARPDDGSAARSLMRAVLPLTDAESPDQETLLFVSRGKGEESDSDGDLSDLPYNPFGAIFLRRIKLDLDVPRMERNAWLPGLSSDAFQYIFKGSEEEIRYRYNPVGIIPHGVQSVHRIVTNKTHRTPIFREDDSNQRDETLFNLEARGYRLPSPPVDDGSDMEDEGEARNDARDIDRKVSDMYKQFLVDMAVKSPAPRGVHKPSYLKLTENERVKVTEDLYNQTRLSDVWREVSWKLGSAEEREMVFGHLFPPPGHETSNKAQNYRGCRYYRIWKEICATADVHTAQEIRKVIRRKVIVLKWLPFAVSDRMWSTSQKSKGFERFPRGSTGPAPHILCRETPTWEDGN